MKHQNCLHFLANQTPEQMMSFVVETQDDKLIVVDGGTNGDAEYLFKTLQEVSETETPKIDAWFLTHPHADHINALIRLLQTRKGQFSVEKLYCNFPSAQFLARCEPEFIEYMPQFYAARASLGAACETITQGDYYMVGAARFEVLYTTDPAFTMNACNNSSAVLRMTLGGQSVLFLGDLGEEAGEKLLAMHGQNLKSDFVQMAHHGQNGVGEAVYRAVSPSACFWCTPQWLWDNDAGKGYNTHSWKTIEVRGWMEKLGVKDNFVEKDGSAVVQLPYAFKK